MANLFGSICLTDIPRELIQTSEKNGKKYLSVIIAERRTPSQYGYTHYIKAYAKRGEVAQDTNLYIGELKPSQYNNESNNQQAATPTPAPKAEGNGDDDLPF